MPLCGHASLASAHILYESAVVEAGSSILFEAPDDLIEVRRQEDWIEMGFPKDAFEAVTDARNLLDELRIDRCEEILRSRFDYYIVRLDGEAEVAGLRPDFSRMRVNGHSCTVTAKGETEGVDFVSRFFAPPVGIDEDPVTGVAHSTLGQYWAEKLGRNRAHREAAFAKDRFRPGPGGEGFECDHRKGGDGVRNRGLCDPSPRDATDDRLDRSGRPVCASRRA